jgi:hypothetical protein
VAPKNDGKFDVYVQHLPGKLYRNTAGPTTGNDTAATMAYIDDNKKKMGVCIASTDHVERYERSIFDAGFKVMKPPGAHQGGTSNSKPASLITMHCTVSRIVVSYICTNGR